MLPSARRLVVWGLVLGGVLWVFLGYRRLRWQAKELPLVIRRLGGVDALADRLASYRKFYLRQNRDSWLASCAARRMSPEGAAQGATRYREGLTGLADWIEELEDGGALTVFDPADERLARVHALRDWLAEEGAGPRTWDCSQRETPERIEALRAALERFETCTRAVAQLDPRTVLGTPVEPLPECSDLLGAPLPWTAPTQAAEVGGPGERVGAPSGRAEALSHAGSADEIVRTRRGGRAIVTSPDGWRIAFVVRRGPRSVVVIDGNESGPWDGVDVENPGPTFSADSRHLGFVATRDGHEVAVVDGRAGPPWDAIRRLTLAPTGDRVAYAARRDGRWRVVVDGVEQPGESAVLPTIVFSPDGRRAAWVTSAREGTAVIVDGVPGPRYDAVGTPTFSPDSRRLVYEAARGGTHLLVADGDERPVGGTLVESGLVFSPDSRQVAWVAREGGRHVTMVDGVRRGAFESVGRLRFSPDSRRDVFYGRDGKEWFVVLDGRRHGPYRTLSSSGPAFSPDSRHAGWVATDASGTHLVLDGDPGPAWQGVAAGSPVFSDAGGRAGWVVAKDRRAHAVVDGELGPAWDRIERNLVFSPDGTRVAYVARRGGEWHVVVDGEAGPGFTQVVSPPVFSPDSRHVAFVVEEQGRRRVVHDGKPEPAFYELDEGTLAFSPDSAHLVYAAWEDGWRLVVDGVAAHEGFGGFVKAATLHFDPPGAVRALAHGGAETDVFRYRLDLAAARRAAR